jgi:Calcineurin-like phosphoesterase
MITSWIAGKLNRKPSPRPAFDPVAPDAPIYVIGDIHGRADLLVRLLARLDPAIPVLCVGDYVDRGEHSAEVLRILQDSPAITCLKGNHETMLLDFLDAPRTGANWLRNGGLQTLASFGIAGQSESSKGADLETARNALGVAMGDGLINWLRNLPLFWQSGNVAVVHAGADPTTPIATQREDFLVWGHPDFTKTPRADGIWVVHGHTITDAPTASNGRIAVDTGAFATNRLTAARIAPGEVSFIST